MPWRTSSPCRFVCVLEVPGRQVPAAGVDLHDGQPLQPESIRPGNDLPLGGHQFGIPERFRQATLHDDGTSLSLCRRSDSRGKLCQNLTHGGGALAGRGPHLLGQAAERDSMGLERLRHDLAYFGDVFDPSAGVDHRSGQRRGRQGPTSHRRG